MLWLVLFAYFIVLFLMFISNFYFSYTPAVVSEGSTRGPKSSALSWMW